MEWNRVHCKQSVRGPCCLQYFFQKPWFISLKCKYFTYNCSSSARPLDDSKCSMLIHFGDIVHPPLMPVAPTFMDTSRKPNTPPSMIARCCLGGLQGQATHLGNRSDPTLTRVLGLEAIDPTSEGADDSGLTDPRPKLQIPGKSPQSYDMTSFNASRGL